jgi:hypothetical protein
VSLKAAWAIIVTLCLKKKRRKKRKEGREGKREGGKKEASLRK